MIRVDSAWLANEPLDMRAGMDTALARVIAVFGAAEPHHAYVFANRRATRMKVLVHDGIEMLPRSWTIFPASSPWSATSGASGLATNARPSRRPLSRRM